MTSSPIRTLKVLIVDNDPLMQQGAVHLIRSQRNWTVDAASYSGLTTHLNQQDKPQVALVGVRNLDFIEVRSINLLKACDIRILACGTFTDITYIRKVIGLGVDGYIGCDETATHLVPAITACANGKQVVFTGNEKQQLFAEIQSSTRYARDRAYIHLTNRERTILQAVAKGMTNREIAQQLSVSLGTVKVHISHLLRKYGLTTRTQLAVDAIRNKHVSVPNTSDMDLRSHPE
jgi:DNA-binding NarL/FixJ family response regulator